MHWKLFFSLAALLALPQRAFPALAYEPSPALPPRPPAEFRAVWITTVGNRDWPSRPGLSTATQKNELIALLDHAVQLKLNVIILQVRPGCDALYESRFEPWSEYLTGTMGRADRKSTRLNSSHGYI